MAFSWRLTVIHVWLLFGLLGLFMGSGGCRNGEEGVTRENERITLGYERNPAAGERSDEGSNERDEERHNESDEDDSDSREHESERPASTPPTDNSVAATAGPCTTCHKDLALKTAHVRKGVACTNCHDLTTAHLKDPGSKPTIPDKRDACLRCHGGGQYREADKVDPNHGGNKGCASCHAIHPRPTP